MKPNEGSNYLRTQIRDEPNNFINIDELKFPQHRINRAARFRDIFQQ